MLFQMFGLLWEPVITALLPVIQVRLRRDLLRGSVEDAFVMQEKTIVEDGKKHRKHDGHQKRSLHGEACAHAAGRRRTKAIRKAREETAGQHRMMTDRNHRILADTGCRIHRITSAVSMTM